VRQVFVDHFIASFAQPPLSLTFDLDAVDDTTHGSQQLTLFHAFYEQYQYLPLVITCAENDQIVMVSLRHGTAAASLGADDDLEFLVTRVRAVWPNVRIRVRGDGGLPLACRARPFWLQGATSSPTRRRCHVPLSSGRCPAGGSPLLLVVHRVPALSGLSRRFRAFLPFSLKRAPARASGPCLWPTRRTNRVMKTSRQLVFFPESRRGAFSLASPFGVP
jgi:Transposase DDE domain group 1